MAREEKGRSLLADNAFVVPEGPKRRNSRPQVRYSTVLMAATRTSNHLIAGFASCLECHCILTSNSGNSIGAGTATAALCLEKRWAMREGRKITKQIWTQRCWRVA